MVSHITLESVAVAFSRWRKARRSRREPVPINLQQQALELLSHYRQIQVLGALRINHSTLKRWQQKSLSSNGFVSLPIATGEDSTSSSIQITLSNQHGAQMCIVGVNTHQLISLTSRFTSEQGGVR